MREERKSAQEILKEEVGDIRNFRKVEKILVAFVAISWAVYQLLLASKQLILNSDIIRSIHLSFAITLLFLNIPLFKNPRKRFRFLS